MMPSKLHVEVSGQSTEPALVLLHPWGANVRFWDECIPHWASRYRIIAYDRRGSGRSPIPAQPYDLDQNVKDLEKIRGDLGLERIVPVGVALGAMLAAVYAARHLDRVSALVLCNPGLVANRGSIEERIALVQRGGMEAILPGAVDRAFAGLPRDDRYRRYLELFRQNDPLGYEYSARAFLDVDLRPILPGIRCSTLVAVGEYDTILPPAVAKQVSAYLPRAAFQLIPQAAHFPPFQNPKTFAEVVDKFLSENLWRENRSSRK
jgi:3-oxoadipate enol-lactonase